MWHFYHTLDMVQLFRPSILSKYCITIYSKNEHSQKTIHYHSTTVQCCSDTACTSTSLSGRPATNNLHYNRTSYRHVTSFKHIFYPKSILKARIIVRGINIIISTTTYTSNYLPSSREAITRPLLWFRLTALGSEPITRNTFDTMGEWRRGSNGDLVRRSWRGTE